MTEPPTARCRVRRRRNVGRVRRWDDTNTTTRLSQLRPPRLESGNCEALLPVTSHVTGIPSFTKKSRCTLPGGVAEGGEWDESDPQSRIPNRHCGDVVTSVQAVLASNTS